jgi:tetratricopeptide (TPR) repeat protein
LESRQIFQELLRTAVNDGERSAARHGLGWIDFALDDFATAEGFFHQALIDRPDEPDYKLALAWALVRQEGTEAWRRAEDLAYELTNSRHSPEAHVCLGVVASRRNEFPSAEYHLKWALETDPYHGSHTDLGALYFRLGRYEDAERELRAAIAQDCYQVQAHVELGAVLLSVADDKASLAGHEFRQALAVDPSSTPAGIGLAQVLAAKGADSEAETPLRSVLQHPDSREKWRLHLELARLLIQRGDKQQSSHLYAEAYSHAQVAIGSAPDKEADPYYVAGVAYYLMGSHSADIRGRLGYRHIAMRHLRDCVRRDPTQADAQRNLLLLEREFRATAPAVWGGIAAAAISFSLLSVLWIMFFASTKVSPTMLMTITPTLIGLFTIATLLPALVRLKLPGFEADLQAGIGAIAPGPTGEVTFGPGRLVVTTGPTGQLSRRRPGPDDSRTPRNGWIATRRPLAQSASRRRLAARGPTLQSGSES